MAAIVWVAGMPVEDAKPRSISSEYADYGYIVESGRIVMEGPAAVLAENKDVKEFYLGMSSEGRESFRDRKSYRRRKRWV